MSKTKSSTTISETIEQQWSQYLEHYELADGCGGTYKPSEMEQAMMIDALAGFLFEDNALSRSIKLSEQVR